ncbi:hypothetical protein [Nocardia sp. CA-119907]|uniref:hypothetical protein n=1 Tax=Nocardia sp. CA-119907 TaxID=3239973 RepID=UPI003D96B8D1
MAATAAVRPSACRRLSIGNLFFIANLNSNRLIDAAAPPQGGKRLQTSHKPIATRHKDLDGAPSAEHCI